MEEAETSVRRRFWAALQTSHYCPLLYLGCRNQSTMARRQINPRLGISCSIEFIRSGRLRAAVAAATRSPAPPGVPSIGEFVPGYEARRRSRRRRTPRHAAIAEPAIKAGCRHGLGACGFALRFRKVIADETEEWAKVVKFSGAPCPLRVKQGRPSMSAATAAFPESSHRGPHDRTGDFRQDFCRLCRHT